MFNIILREDVTSLRMQLHCGRQLIPPHSRLHETGAKPEERRRLG